MTAIHIPTLADSAMLMYVKIGIWTARKLDKKQSQNVVRDNAATADAARVNKNLLANAGAALQLVARKGNEIRAFVETNTLPWDDAGNRLVSNSQALKIIGEMHRLEQEFNTAVDDFVREYPVLRAQALHNLGTMADSSDYPQPDVVRSKFSMKVSFNPLPSGFGDIREGMSQQQAAAWQSHFEGNVKSQVSSALRSAWDRLAENLLKYSDRLTLADDDSGKTRVFRDTMVTGLRETCDLLESLNVFKDPDLTTITGEVRAKIATYGPDQLRNSLATACTVKNDADDILKRMQAYLER